MGQTGSGIERSAPFPCRGRDTTAKNSTSGGFVWNLNILFRRGLCIRIAPGGFGWLQYGANTTYYSKIRRQFTL